MASSKEVAKKAEIDLGFSDQDMMMIMMVVMMFAVLQSAVMPAVSAATAAAASVQSLQYEGKTDPREVDVPSDSIVWLDLIHSAPMTPWTYARIENTGPNDVEVGINDPNDRFIVAASTTKNVDRLGARERISIIFFYCRPTETAHLNVIGEY